MTNHVMYNGIEGKKLFVSFDKNKWLYFSCFKPPVLRQNAQLSLAVLIYSYLPSEERAAMRKAIDVIDNPSPATAT